MEFGVVFEPSFGQLIVEEMAGLEERVSVAKA